MKLIKNIYKILLTIVFLPFIILIMIFAGFLTIMIGSVLKPYHV